MPTYRELLAQLRSEIDEVDAVRARELLTADDPPLLVDVRELDEWAEGRIPGAIHVPRGNLESRIENAAPDKSQPIVLYCAGGNRSVFAAKTLEELGYENVVSLAGGYTDWKRNGFDTELPRSLDDDEARALQPAPPHSRGRRGRPDEAPRLARPAPRRRAASALPPRSTSRPRASGRLGIVDDDKVDASNLQRQVLHSTARLGEWKAESARRTLQELNPDVEVVPYRERISSENVERILADGWDVIVDGTDNFPTRYLVNDAARVARHPARARLDLPLRGPGHRLRHAKRAARATAASSRCRRRPSSRRRARRAACSACCRASSARSRRARR